MPRCPICGRQLKHIYRYSGGRDNHNNNGRLYSCEEHGLQYETDPLEKYQQSKEIGHKRFKEPKLDEVSSP